MEHSHPHQLRMLMLMQVIMMRESQRKEPIQRYGRKKILRCLEPVEVPKPEPAPKKDFLEQALCTIGMQMRENLSHNEVLDLIEDIQGMVNWACREKRRRIEMANQVSNNQMYQGP